MTEAGGASTQAGIHYQNTVAARALLELLTFEPQARREQVVEVRVEAPESVDDLVVRFADGHRDFRTVKLSLQKGGSSWKALWEDLAAQLSADGQSQSDTLSIFVGTENQLGRHVADVCACAESSIDCMEFAKRLNKAQANLVGDIARILGSDTIVFEVLKRTLVVFLSESQIEREFKQKGLTSSHVDDLQLLGVLRDWAGGEARRRGIFSSSDLRLRLLSEHGIRIEEPTDWGLASYRGYLKRRSQIQIPGTHVTRPAEELFVWPRVREFDRTRFTSFEDETFRFENDEAVSRFDLSTFPTGTEKNLIVVAGPGHGKTAMLSTISGQLADSVYIPVSISLAAFCESKEGLLSHIQNKCGHELSVIADWHRLCERGLLILLLDGLDEVPSVNRLKVIDRLETFTALFPEVPWILTVRDPAVVSGLGVATMLELLPLNDDDIVRFADVMKSVIGGVDGWKFLNRIKLYPDIDRLARIPLFLSMLLAVTDLSAQTPMTRSNLIEAYLKTIFQPEAHKPDFYGADHSALLRSVAEKIAFLCLEKQQIGASEQEVRQVVCSVSENDHAHQAVLFDRLKTNGILKSQNSVRLQFPYPIIQEYLAASHLIERHISTISTRITDAVNRPWAQVLQFALEMHSEPEADMRAMLEERDDAFSTGLRLVGRCIANGAKVSPAFRDEIGERLVEYWIHAPTRSREQVGRLLADGFADPLSPKLRTALHHRWLIQDGAGEIISKVEDTELTLSVLRSLITNDRSSIMIYPTLKPALRSVGDQVLEMVKVEMKGEHLTDQDVTNISCIMSNLDSDVVSRELALSIARDNFPRQVQFRAFELAGAPLVEDGIQLVLTGFRSENWDRNYEARELVRLHPDPESFLLDLLIDESVSFERKLDLVGDTTTILGSAEGRRAFATRVIRDEKVNLDLRLAFSLFEAGHGDLAAFEDLLERSQELPIEILANAVTLFGRFPIQELADKSAELMRNRVLSADDVARLAVAARIGFLHTFELDMWFGGGLKATTAHPGIASWLSLLKDWSTRNDLSPQTRIELLTTAAELGCHRATSKLEEELSQFVDMDAEEWKDGDEYGHTLTHALHLILKRQPSLTRPPLMEVVLSSTRYNIKRLGLIALVNRADLESLRRLIDLHSSEGDWIMSDTMANSIELLAARLGVTILTAHGKYEIADFFHS